MIKELVRVAVIASASCFCLPSCSDGDSLGSSLTKGEVAIEVDSTFCITGHSVYTPVMDSRSQTQLVGRISVPEYGDLDCSFVTQFMPAMSMNVADTITVDDVVGMKLKFRTTRGDLTGDSLAPQQLKVFALNRQLPQDITNDFDPAGYYNPSTPLGIKNYTVSLLGKHDSLFYRSKELQIGVDMPLSLAREVFNAYRTNPDIFEWPQTFAKYFPGIYVTSTFGRGCIMNVAATEMCTYYTYKSKKVVIENGTAVSRDTLLRDSVTLFSSAPEVLSSNNIRLKISDNIKNMVASGRTILLSPAGYNAEIIFPAQAIIDKYKTSEFNLAVINNLTISIPVKPIDNDYGINPPTWLLMVKTKELKSFFEENKVPDDKSSFWATYDVETGCYNFTSMRDYILDLMKSGEKVKPEDYTFTILPVKITTENGGSSYNPVVYVSTCTPYISRPTMCEILPEKATVKFTFSKQLAK